jgi:signal transduction histidine kinase
MLERVTAARALQGVIGALRGGLSASDVLATLLEEARAMLEADEAYILLRDRDWLRLRAGVGIPPSERRARLPLDEGLEGWAASHREPVVVVAAFRDARHRDAFGRDYLVGALAAYPIVARDVVSGVIAATRRAPGRFADPDLWWLDLLGGLAATVLENDAVGRTQERRARQAEILADIDSRPADPSASRFDQCTSALSRGLGADQVAVYLADRQANELVIRSAAGEGLPERIPLDSGAALTAVYVDGSPLVYPGEGGSARMLDEAIQAAVAVPIGVGGERRGVLYLGSRSAEAIAQLDQAFLNVVAARLGMAIEQEELGARRQELERARAEAEAHQALVGVISHELKTPVAVIQAYTDLLLRRAERTKDEANVDVLRRIGEQADRMLGLIDQLLDIQRLEAGLFSLEPARFDLAALARRIGEETEATARADGIAVVTYADPPKIPVVADRRRIEEVLQNLLQNAVKYTRAGGRVEVRLRQSGERAVVAVRDWGVGIHPDEQAHVFDRFYQGRSRLGGGHIGLGLGLYISREIVRRHGGEIWLESFVGKGSTFYFSLPLQGVEPM